MKPSSTIFARMRSIVGEGRRRRLIPGQAEQCMRMVLASTYRSRSHSTITTKKAMDGFHSAAIQIRALSFCNNKNAPSSSPSSLSPSRHFSNWSGITDMSGRRHMSSNSSRRASCKNDIHPHDSWFDGEEEAEEEDHALQYANEQQLSRDFGRQGMENDAESQKRIRLSKRMSQLDMASRREADRWIQEGRVFVGDQVAVTGMKVDPDETDIRIVGIHSTATATETASSPSLLPPAVALNKPLGFVSGQPDNDSYIPAVRLLTRENEYKPLATFTGDDKPGSPTQQNEDEVERLMFQPNIDPSAYVEDFGPTLQGYVCAGRLDMESTGLLIFTNSGVLAKKLVGSPKAQKHKKPIPKEYYVAVQKGAQVSRREREKYGLKEIPRSTLNLTELRQGGAKLAGDEMPLKPVKVSWVEPGSVLRFVLREGRKHQIRRMCRELLGYHVIALHRQSIGPVKLNDDMRPGSWRPLTEEEIQGILGQDEKQ